MSKMKKIILIFICIFIIGGVIYGATYVNIVKGESVQAIKIKWKI